MAPSFHASGDVGAALDEGIPDAGAVGEDIDEFVSIQTGFSMGCGSPGSILRGAHGAERAVDEESEVRRFRRCRRDRLRQRWTVFAADGSSVIEIARGGRGRWGRSRQMMM